MNKTTKLSILVLIILMMIVLVACSDKDTETEQATQDATKNVLVMATEAKTPPYVYYSDDDAIIGIDVDVARAVANYLGMDLKIENMAFASILSSVKNGKADIGMAAIMPTEEWSNNVNFSDTYANSIQVIITRLGSDITGPENLADKSVAVIKNTIGELYVKSDYPNANVQSFANGAAAARALQKGKVNAIVIDREPAKALVLEYKGLVILNEDYSAEDYAIAISKANKELKSRINDALTALKEDGTLQTIVNKYITAE